MAARVALSKNVCRWGEITGFLHALNSGLPAKMPTKTAPNQGLGPPKINRKLAKRLERFDAIRGSGMGGQKAAAGIAVTAHEPGQGIDHRVFGIAGTFE